MAYLSNLGLVGLALGFSSQATRHGIDLTLAPWHSIKDVDVQVLLNDVPDLVVLSLLQVPLQQLVRISGNAQHKLAGTEVQQGLVASHVLFFGQAGQNTQVIFIVALLISTEPGEREQSVRRVSEEQSPVIREEPKLNIVLTFERMPLPRFHDCCTPAQDTCAQTAGRRPGTVQLCGSLEQIL